ncbi:fimbrillin family protein [uncultured Bacteroides sp.]|uniref:fimbrillin family protein n=1 Tax=uncultured Bacteroides sp. TaxID=162156 RepID=UPI002635FA64|nr:fimbrillin family protein [uncultured Bacteroides sp.]
MRKHLFYLAAAIVAMSSCTESEVVEVSQSKAIGFNGFVGNQTRAEQEGLTQENLDEFYAFGSYKMNDGDEVVVFDGKTTGSSQIKKNGDTWQYAPVNYWLEGAVYKFAAYAPKLTEIPTFDYNKNSMSINFVSDGKKDLLIAATTQNGYTALKENNAGVNLNFKHALSKVRFTIVDGWRNELKMVISDVSLNGAKNTGTLTTPTDLATVTALEQSVWKLSEEKKGTYNDAGTGTDSPLTNNGETYVFENFLLPQTIETEANAVTLEFTVTVTNNHGGGPVIGEEGTPHTKTLTITIPNTTVTSWLPGKAYNYTLTIDGKTFGLETIYFENITVETWGDEAETEIEAKAN